MWGSCAWCERDVAGGDGLPAVLFVGRDVSAAVPWATGAGFASRVGDLDPGDGAVVVKEAHDAREIVDVLILIYPEVPVGDATSGFDGACFEDDEAGSPHGAAAEMDEVPVVGEAVGAGVLAHGRDDDAVFERDVPKLKGIEEMSGRGKSGGTSVHECIVAKVQE